MNNDIFIRKLTVEDVPIIVDIHLNAFKDFFLTTLGTAFLRKYYKTVICHNDSICIGCEDQNGDIIGFAIGNRIAKGFHIKILRKHWFIFLLEGIRLLIFKPKSIIRLSRNISKNKNASDYGFYSELLSLGVNDSATGKGVGSKLIKQFESIAIKMKSTKICLTTDKNKNEGSLCFYFKNGYNIYYEFETYPHRNMYKLIKYLV